MTHVESWWRRPGTRGLVALAVAVMLVAAACGGGGDDGGTASDTTGGDESAGEPQYGGQIVYGLEAENGGGWCLPEAQLAISGIQVARAIYDTLTVPNETGKYVPYLADTVEASDDYKTWTITLRDGVKFHDGTDLTAEVVKNNLDAYRGAYPARTPLLFVFVFDNIANVEAVDPLTVEVTMKQPWVDFDAFLYTSGRVGIMAQAQLDDPDTCDRKLIGTGPFKFEDWVQNDHLTATRNEDYWYSDPANGNQLPYVDSVEFRPITEAAQRVNALQSGEVNLMHTSDGDQIAEMRKLADSGDIDSFTSEDFTEVSYTMFNTAKPPFDSKIAREAAVLAVDEQAVNEIANSDVPTVANGPFAPGSIGYLEDTGFPPYDPERAKQLVSDYEDECGCDFEFTYLDTPDPESIALDQLLQQYFEDAGMKVSLKQLEQAQQINAAIAGDFQALGWRNHPGGDPDEQYVWWHSGSPVNFGQIDDARIDELLEQGRTTPEPAARKEIYEDLNSRFGSELYNMWRWWTPWTLGSATDVHGLLGPDLPDGSGPFPGIAVGHPLTSVWIG